MMEVTLYLCDLPHKNSNPSLILRKTPEKFQCRDILENAWPVLLKSVITQGKSKKLLHSKAA